MVRLVWLCSLGGEAKFVHLSRENHALNSPFSPSWAMDAVVDWQHVHLFTVRRYSLPHKHRHWLAGGHGAITSFLFSSTDMRRLWRHGSWFTRAMITSEGRKLLRLENSPALPYLHISFGQKKEKNKAIPFREYRFVPTEHQDSRQARMARMSEDRFVPIKRTRT
jgi:hypothetical protein